MEDLVPLLIIFFSMALVFGLLIMGAVESENKNSKLIAKCEEAGGVPIYQNGEWIIACIDADAIIKLE